MIITAIFHHTTTLPTQDLTLTNISRNPNLIDAKISEIAPATRDQNQNNNNKHQKHDQDYNCVYRKLHAISFPDAALYNRRRTPAHQTPLRFVLFAQVLLQPGRTTPHSGPRSPRPCSAVVLWNWIQQPYYPVILSSVSRSSSTSLMV